MSHKKEWKTLDSATLYAVGWIAALPLEKAAALALLDERHNRPQDFVRNQNDNNNYSWGRISDHNIVITCLPDAEYGKGSAAVTANGLLSSLPHIRIGLLVGIGAGVPQKDDILLGDVVVSSPGNSDGGVVQYDLYKAKRKNDSSERERKGFLNSPPLVLRSTLSALQAEHELSGSEICKILDPIKNNEIMRVPYGFPGAENDHLRKQFANSRVVPAIHYGTIASGDTLIKDAIHRDELVGWLRAENIYPVCFEMEAAGLMNSFPCLVIRGICDYADEQKNDIWQRYAAATAAAFAKEFLGYLDSAEVTVTAKIGQVLERVNDLRHDIESGLANIHSDIIDNKAFTQLRSALHIAQGATYDSYQDEYFSLCLEGTRKELLEQITTWADERDGKCIFWLCGKAGTGKSTIARTVGKILDDSNRLGASFFFKRGEGDRSNASLFVSTIVRQLLDKVPDASGLIAAALNADSLLCERELQQQFKKLLLDPFSSLTVQQVPDLKLTIVIDALDECERSDDIRKILNLLSRVGTISPVRLRILVTSRPELPLQLGFQELDGSRHQDVILEEVQAATIDRDIRIYLEHQLNKIRDSTSIQNLAPLSREWPGDDKIQALVELAVPLFIFAVTACRYISIRDPEERLETILQQRQNPFLSGLSKMYVPILQAKIIGHEVQERKQAITDFRDIVGAIVLLSEPLSIISVSNLLGVSEGRIGHTLSGLQSLLYISRDAPIRLFHLSFRDFLIGTNDTQAGGFHIDERQTHAKLSDHCLRCLEKPGVLRQDVCDIGRPGVRRIEIQKQWVKDCIPGEIAYACSYWVVHTIQSGQNFSDSSRVYRFLRLHFLHWLECLSWLGRLSIALEHIIELQSFVKDNINLRISAFLDDALRFVLSVRHIIELAPLQLYQSALIFAPSESIVRKSFLHKVHTTFSLPEVSSSWTAELLRFEHHLGFQKVAFSADSKLLALASGDHVLRVFDNRTGLEVQAFEGHVARISSVVFSPDDSKLLVSASWDKTIILWNTSTGQEIRALEGHTGRVLAVSFSSPDTQFLRSVSNDYTTRLWNIDTGLEAQKLEIQELDPEMITISPNGYLIVQESDNGDLLSVDADTGQHARFGSENTYSDSIVAFSTNNKFLAITSGYSLTVDIYDGYSKQIVYTHRRNEHMNTSSMAFSHDGRLLALASVSPEMDKCFIELLSTDTGQVEQELQGHTAWIHDMAFSSNDKILASLSWDGTARLWNAISRPKTQISSQHDEKVALMSFSTKGTVLASMSYEGMEIFLWDVNTGQITWKLSSIIGGFYKTIAFSPLREDLLAVAQGDTILLVNVRTRLKVHTASGHSGRVKALAFSPNGKLLASASKDDTIRIWDTSTWHTVSEIMLDFEGWNESVETVVFSPDSKLLAYGPYGQSWSGIKVWKTNGWQEIQISEPKKSDVGNMLTFSPCGQPLAYALNSSAGTEKVWETSTWQIVRQWRRNRYVIDFATWASVKFVHDGSSFVDRASASSGFQEELQQDFPIVKGEWVQWQGQDLFWLPHEYRTDVIARHGNILALGQYSGRVSFLKATGP